MEQGCVWRVEMQLCSTAQHLCMSTPVPARQPYQIRTGLHVAHGRDVPVDRSRVGRRVFLHQPRTQRLAHEEAEFQGPHVIAQERAFSPK